jgi:hypothetical protein
MTKYENGDKYSITRETSLRSMSSSMHGTLLPVDSHSNMPSRRLTMYEQRSNHNLRQARLSAMYANDKKVCRILVNLIFKFTNSLVLKHFFTHRSRRRTCRMRRQCALSLNRRHPRRQPRITITIMHQTDKSTHPRTDKSHTFSTRGQFIIRCIYGEVNRTLVFGFFI